MGSPLENNEVDLNIRLLPANISYLKTHTKLNSGDVATLNGGTIRTYCTQFARFLQDTMSHFPIAVTVFCKNQLDDKQYCEAVLDGFPSILTLMKAHCTISYEQAKLYVKSPSAQSGNAIRYKPKRKAPTDPAEYHAQTGTYTLSKYGTRKNIWSYIADVPFFMRKSICLGKAHSTWDSYVCSWRNFSGFCKIRRRQSFIPVDSTLLCEYVIFLFDQSELQYTTILSYLSALRKLHKLNRLDDSMFDCPRLKETMLGILHESTLNKAVDPDRKYRCVLTWEVLKIFGHSLFKSSDIEQLDKQVIWTLSLFAFFGACRGGELLSKSINSFDPFRVISWSKVRRMSDNHILVDLVVPKTSEKPEGVVVDIFAFTGDKVMCPIHNCDVLIEMVKHHRGLALEDPVFVMYSGKLFTPAHMNDLMKKFLNPYFPDAEFSSHSFRSALPSHMAANPEIFSAEDAKLGGRWGSEAVKRYQRLNGYAQEKLFKKLDQFLKVCHFLKFHHQFLSVKISFILHLFVLFNLIFIESDTFYLLFFSFK